MLSEVNEEFLKLIKQGNRIPSRFGDWATIYEWFHLHIP